MPAAVAAAGDRIAARDGVFDLEGRIRGGRPPNEGEIVIHAITRHHAKFVLAALLAALAGAGPAAAASAPKVSARPALSPAFKPSIHDYVSRCKASSASPFKLRLKAPAGGTIAANGGTPHRGTFRVKLPLRTNERAVVRSRVGGKTSVYNVRCLPRNFPKWTAHRFGATQTALYLIAPDGPGASRYITMVDHNGTPIWWYAASTNGFDAKLLSNGNVAWSRYYTNDILGYRPSQAYEEHTLTGRRVRLIKAVGSPTDIHDMQPLANGNRLVVSYKSRKHVDLRQWGGPQDAEVLDGVVQEITPKGKAVFQWNSKDHVSNDEKGPNIGTPVKVGNRLVYDLVHLNSVEPHGKNELLLSMRATNALYDIDKTTGKILWKLGGTHTPESLLPVGDSHTQLFGGQHDARVLPDGTITLHDNRTGTGDPPRGVRFRIDTTTHTATLLEQVSDPLVPLSNFAGSARRLPGGDWVASWGGTPTVTELGSSGKVVFRLQLEKGWFTYRAFPIRPGQLKFRTLRRAMDRMARG
jgi:hypothetical protein